MLEILKKEFEIRKLLLAVFLFNDYPLLNEIELIEKLRIKFQDRIDIFALFSKRFKVEREIEFSYSFVRNRFLCKGEREGKSFFALMDNGKLVHLSNIYDLSEMLFLIEKKVNSDFKYTQFMLNSEEVKRRILERLTEGQLNLLNLRTNKKEFIEKFENKNVIFIHGACTPCQLEKVFEKVYKERNADKIYIFSFLASQSELSQRLISLKSESNFYLDYSDEFGLAFSGSKKEFIFEIKQNSEEGR